MTSILLKCPGALILLSFLAGAQSPANSGSHHSQRHIQQARVFKLTEITKDNKIVNDSQLISLTIYDKKGHVLENEVYAEGSSVKRTTTVYDRRNRLLEETEFNGNGTVLQRKTYKYNDRDSLIERANYEIGNELDYKESFSYNKQGKKTMEVTTKEEADGIIKKIIFSYDDKGNLTKEVTTDGKDSVILSYQWKYDTHNRTEEIRKNRSRQEWQFIYTYTDSDNLVKEQHIYPYETSNSAVIMQYDDSHHLVSSVTYDYKNRIIQNNSFAYQYGKLAESRENNSITKFEYDSSGNKISEKILVDNELISDKTFNKHGELLTFAHYKSGNILTFTEYYIYNDAHRLLKFTTLDKNNNLVEENEYNYDHEGNIVLETNCDANAKVRFKTGYVYSYFRDSGDK